MYIPFNETWERMLLATFHPFATNGAQRRFKMVSRCCSWSTTVCREREKCFCEHLSRQMFLSVVKNVFQFFFFCRYIFSPKKQSWIPIYGKKKFHVFGVRKRLWESLLWGNPLLSVNISDARKDSLNCRMNFASHCFCLWLNWSINLFF